MSQPHQIEPRPRRGKLDLLFNPLPSLKQLNERFPELDKIRPTKQLELYERAMAASPWWVRYHYGFLAMGYVAVAAIVAPVGGSAGWLPSLPQIAAQVIAFLAFTGLAHLLIWPRVRREIWKRVPKICPACGYDLTANASGVCPECGRAVAADRG